MEKLVSVAEMQSVEREADQKGLSYAQMMVNAGKGLAAEIEAACSHIINGKVLALVGSGNNGGDALVALNRLIQNGWSASAYLVRLRERDDKLLGEFIELGGKVVAYTEDPGYSRLKDLLNDQDVLVDGVLGTGMKLPLKGEVANMLQIGQDYVRQHIGKPFVVAVDCPSGVDCDSGKAAPQAIPAALTVGMAAIKRGLLAFPAAGLTGDVRVTSIGQVAGLDSWKQIRHWVVAGEDVRKMLPPRPEDAHKGTFGTALIVAGSANYTGAALLAGEAAYRIGAGLVSMAVPEPLHGTLAGHLPEATWLLLPHKAGNISVEAAQTVKENFGRATAMLLGPGFGMESATRDFVARLIGYYPGSAYSSMGLLHEGKKGESGKLIDLPPLVVDADGLKHLAGIPDWHTLLPEQSVLTPHPGEMAIMTGQIKEAIQEDRIGVATRFAVKWRHVVVLKGAFTVIAAPDGEVAMIPIATAALARAGTGDVLAGLITGLRAQGVGAFQAAVAGAWIHAQAGLLAVESLGTTASVLARDVLGHVASVLGKI